MGVSLKLTAEGWGYPRPVREVGFPFKTMSGVYVAVLCVDGKLRPMWVRDG